MGLDQYAFITNEVFDRPIDFEPEQQTQLHYWRKHPNLHGWMADLYSAKGGTDVDFNGNPVMLTADDLKRLELDVRKGVLPETQGFFFGMSTGEERADDLTFIAKANEAITNGYTVYYDSWW